LILRVVENYYSVIVAREDLLAANEAVRTAEVNEQRVEKMQATGLIVDSDLLSAKVFLAQVKDREIRAQNSLELSQMALAREIGLGSEARPEPSVSLPEPPPIQGTRQEWMQTAVEHRPALRAAQLREDATTDEKRASKADFGPKIGLYGDVERDALTLGGSAGTNWTAGARLDFNLFAGGAQRSRLVEAQANENKAKHGLEWLRSGVLLEVQQSYLAATAAAQRAATARDSVEQAQEALRIIQNRYEAGLTNITELLRAQTAQLEARIGYLSSVHDWQVARAELERSAGVLTIDSMLLQGTGAQ
jgi:outer membrane protein